METNGIDQPGRDFGFLQSLWPDLLALAVDADNAVNSTPDFSAVRLRGFTEAMVVHIFEHINLQLVAEESQFDRLQVLEEGRYLNSEILSKFHTIRKFGNKAAHNGSVSTFQAESLIEDAWSLAAWFCRFIHPEIDWLTPGCSVSLEPTPNADEISPAAPESRRNVTRFPEERVNQIHEQANAALTLLDPKVRQLKTQITLREAFDVELNDDQERCLTALEGFLADDKQRIFLLKGFAGTGKTFLAAGLTEYFLTQGRNFSLAAPTGRAAKVVASKTRQSARTIHSLIYDYSDMIEEGEEGSATFKMIAKIAQNGSPINSVYIVDEASLVSDVYSESEFFRSGSGYILQDLMAHIGVGQPGSARKIIFVGDPAQLPPVGMPSSPALDFEYLRQKFGLDAFGYELTEIVRQNAESMVLQNVKPLRESLSRDPFSANGSLAFSYDDDVVRLDKERVPQHYIKIREGRGAQAPIIVTHSNAEASEFNRAIRSKLFPDREFVCAGDKVIAAANGFCATHYITNGETLQIESVEQTVDRRSVQLQQKISETGETETIDVSLTFRDVKVVLPQFESDDVIVATKILDDFLHGKDATLEPIVQRALYVDFLKRHKHLDRKREKDEFRLALRSDPYFNGLRLRFGYAVTCHKAQGGEWSHVIVSCPTRLKPNSPDFFRWLYTAMTRTSSKLYLVDPPDEHLRPVGPGWVMSPPGEDFEQHDLPSAASEPDDRNHFSDVSQVVSAQVLFESGLHEEVRKRLKAIGTEIEDIAHHPYREAYFLKRGAESARVDINYRANHTITNISPVRSSAFSDEALKHLNSLIGKKTNSPASVGGKSTSPTRPFLKEFHERLMTALIDKGISVSSLEEQKWNQRYSLMRGSDQVVVDIFYNGKEQLTKFQPVKPKSNPEPTLVGLQQDVLAVLTIEIRP